MRITVNVAHLTSCDESQRLPELCYPLSIDFIVTSRGRQLPVNEVEVPLQSLEGQVLKAPLPAALKSVNTGKRTDPIGKSMMNFEGGFPDRAQREVWLFVICVSATLRPS